MKAEEIRAWASRAKIGVDGIGADEFPTPSVMAAIATAKTLDIQMGQMLMLAEIAAQLAEANKLAAFELGLDEEKEG